MGKTKTDNKSLATKIALRRELLDALALTEVDVLDACAGAGTIWTTMRQHVTVRRWTRCDLKPRQAGTLTLSAEQAMRSLPLASFNVIDIDPYGEPWDAYLEALPRLRQPTAMFLTRGHVMMAMPSIISREAVGIPKAWNIPRSPRLAAYVGAQILSQTWRFADIVHASAVELPHVTYYALGLQPHV
jgi:hypothetical protein